MASEEPPVLKLGTEVSAKYKGAFCEAKVKKVVQLVKCKVTLKETSSSIVVVDADLQGPLKVGVTVEVKHPETGLFVEAVILKLTDCSTYTVVFDDGDESTLRRTQINLKGDKHFVQSETLDELPLTHPEHFGTPVMKTSKSLKTRNSSAAIGDDSDSDTESSASSVPVQRKYKGRLSELIGRVICMTQEDRKKTMWVPALVANPNADDMDLKSDHLLVKSFKDSKFSTVAKKDTKEFTRDMALKNDDKSLKAAFEKAMLYFDTKSLPSSWNKEELLGTLTDEDDDSDLSDDEPNEEKDHFVAQLYKFMDDRGTPINKAPVISSRDLNLYRLFRVVHNLGGYNRVTNQMKWRIVYSKMNLPSCTNASNQIKAAYKKYLHAYEDFYRKLGFSMGTVTGGRPGRSRHNSGRNIIFRERDSPKSPRSDKRAKAEASSSEKEEEPEKEHAKPKDTEMNKGKDVKEPEKPKPGPSEEKKADVKKPKEESDNETESPTRKGRSRVNEDKKTPAKDKEEKTKKLAVPEKEKAKVSRPITRDEIRSAKDEIETKEVSKKVIKEKEPKLEKKELKVDMKAIAKDARDELKKTPKDDNKKTQKDKEVDKVKEDPKKTPKGKDQDKDADKDDARKTPKSKESKDGDKIIKDTPKKTLKQKEEAKRAQKEDNVKLPDIVVKQEAAADHDDDTKVPKRPRKRSARIGEIEKVKTDDVPSPQVKKEPDIPPESPAADDPKQKKKEELDNSDENKQRSTRAAKDDGNKEEDKKSSKEEEKKSLEIKKEIRTRKSTEERYPVGSRLKVKYGKGKNYKIYEAKVVEAEGNSNQYLVHYAGWNHRYDEWVNKDRIVNVVELPDSSKPMPKLISPKAGKPPKPTVKKPKSADSPVPSPKASTDKEKDKPAEARTPKAPSSNSSTASNSATKPRPTRSNSIETMLMGLPPKPKRRNRRNSGYTETSDVTSHVTDSDDEDNIEDIDDSAEDDKSVQEEKIQSTEPTKSAPVKESTPDQPSKSEKNPPVEPIKPSVPLIKISTEPTKQLEEPSPVKVKAASIDAAKREETKTVSKGEQKQVSTLSVEKTPEIVKKDEPVVVVVGKSAPAEQKPQPISSSVTEKEEPILVAPEKQVSGRDASPAKHGPKPKPKSKINTPEVGRSPTRSDTQSNIQADTPEKKDDLKEAALDAYAFETESEKDLKDVMPSLKKERKREASQSEEADDAKGVKRKRLKVDKEEKPEKPKAEKPKVAQSKSPKKQVKPKQDIPEESAEVKKDGDADMEKNEKKKTKKKVKKKKLTPEQCPSDSDDSEQDTQGKDPIIDNLNSDNKALVPGDTTKLEVSSTETVIRIDKSITSISEPEVQSSLNPSDNEKVLSNTSVVPKPEQSASKVISADMQEAADLLSNISQVKPLISRSHEDSSQPQKPPSDHVPFPSTSGVPSTSETTTMFVNTPPDTPEHSMGSPEQVGTGGSSPSQDEGELESTRSDQEANLEVQSFMQPTSQEGGESPNACDTSTISNGSGGSSGNAPSSEESGEVASSSTGSKRKSDAEEPPPPKRRRRGHKRLVNSEKKNTATKHNMSDSDDGNAEAANTLAFLAQVASQSPVKQHTPSVTAPSTRSNCDSEVPKPPRPPRQSKYNFNIEEGKYLEGENRISFLSEKMHDIRKVYMQLKAEVACIDRRRKRARRKEKEAAAAAAASMSGLGSQDTEAS